MTTMRRLDLLARARLARIILAGAILALTIWSALEVRAQIKATRDSRIVALGEARVDGGA